MYIGTVQNDIIYQGTAKKVGMLGSSIAKGYTELLHG